MVTVRTSLQKVKDDYGQLIPPLAILHICAAINYQFRQRLLGPVETIYLFLVQVLNGNTAWVIWGYLGRLPISGLPQTTIAARGKMSTGNGNRPEWHSNGTFLRRLRHLGPSGDYTQHIAISALANSGNRCGSRNSRKFLLKEVPFVTVPYCPILCASCELHFLPDRRGVCCSTQPGHISSLDGRRLLEEIWPEPIWPRCHRENANPVSPVPGSQDGRATVMVSTCPVMDFVIG